MVGKNVIGKQWFHTFLTKDGTVLIPCTQEEYETLKGETPKYDGTWVQSHECYLYDTATGYLEDNQYAVDPENGLCIVKMGKWEVSIEPKLIASDTITAEGIALYEKLTFK